MKTNFQPTDEEAKELLRYTRGVIKRCIDPQPWSTGEGMWMWRRVGSPREFDVAWAEGMADDMMDEKCPYAKRGRVFWTSEAGKKVIAKVKAESVRAEKTPEGWFWVIMWRAV